MDQRGIKMEMECRFMGESVFDLSSVPPYILRAYIWTHPLLWWVVRWGDWAGQAQRDFSPCGGDYKHPTPTSSTKANINFVRYYHSGPKYEQAPCGKNAAQLLLLHIVGVFWDCLGRFLFFHRFHAALIYVFKSRNI